jgi:non-ribosomal peptide synthetase component F
MPDFESIPQLMRYGIQNYASNNLLLSENKVITYAKLEVLSIKFAGLLNKHIKVPNGLIAVMGANPIDVYSVLLAGHAYLPIDARWPIAHINTVIDDARPAVLLCRLKFISREIQKIYNCEVVAIDDEWEVIVFNEPHPIAPGCVYVLYTSGSSGKPKGVVHTHKSAMAFLNWCAAEFTMTETPKCISIAPFQFDLSVFDLFFPFFSGGSLLTASVQAVSNTRWMAEVIDTKKINIIYSTPSFFKLLLKTGRVEKFDYSHVKYVLSAGERLTYALADNIKHAFPNAQLYNLYGPTETNVCTYHVLSKTNESADVPIGKCCPYAQAFVNENKELFIAGDSLMQGYLNEVPAITTINNKPYYPTGDLVGVDSEGNFVYKGRIDNMLKRNGYRIEPAQVEQCMSKLTDIGEVKVFGYYKSDGNARLIAFMAGGHNYTALQCKLHCLNYLPDYMVPDKFVMLNEWPLNLNNKTDWQALLQQYD